MKTKHFGLALFLLFCFFSCAYAAGVDAPTDTQWFVGLTVAALLGSLQSLCLFVLVSMRADNKEAHNQLWAEIKRHGHVVSCDQDGCKPKTVAL